jgi:hypothetical protein
MIPSIDNRPAAVASCLRPICRRLGSDGRVILPTERPRLGEPGARFPTDPREA